MCQVCIFCCVKEGLKSRLWLLSFPCNNSRNTPFSAESPWQRQPLSANCGGWRRTWNLKKELSLLPYSLPAWPACPLTSCPPPPSPLHQWKALQSTVLIVHPLSYCWKWLILVSDTSQKRHVNVLDPDPHALPNKILWHTWGMGEPESCFGSPICTNISKATEKHLFLIFLWMFNVL